MEVSGSQPKTRFQEKSTSKHFKLPLDASSQFPIDSWTLCFLDKDVELAHSVQTNSSLVLKGVNAIINILLVIVYTTGVSAGCKGILTTFPQIMAISISHQAVELCLNKLFVASFIKEQRSYIEFSKAIFEGLVLFYMNFPVQSEETMFDYEPDTAFCTHFGLLSDCMVVLLCLLIPYLVHATALTKFTFSGVVFIIHAMAPFWASIEIELSAIVMSILVGNALGYALEHTLRSVFREQYARRADQELAMRKEVGENLRLVHTIKGKCGTANSLAAGILACFQRVRDEHVAHAVQLMRRMCVVLEEAEWWCEHRQLFVHLELGTYTSKRAVCNVYALLTKLAGPESHVHECPAESCVLDEAVLRLVLDEAMSNARKFGNPEAQVEISTQIEENDGAYMLMLQVDNVNGEDVPSTEQCARVLEADHKASGVSAFSDGVGLAGMERAATAIGGRVWLESYATPARAQHTVLHLRMPVDRVVWRKCETTAYAEPRVQPEHEASSVAATAVMIAAANSSQADNDWQQDPLSEQSRASAASRNERRSDQEAVQALPSDLRSCPLICLGLDDSDMCRMFHEFLFENFLSADPERSTSLGKTPEEIERFVDVALGLVSPELRPVPEGERRVADVVLIDQHMEIGLKRWMGTDIARKLRSAGFQGVICVMSGIGNEDLKAMQAEGTIDIAVAKGESPVEMAEKILGNLGIT